MNESGAPREPYLLWCGGLMCIVMAVALVGVIAASSGWLQLGESPLAIAAEPGSESPVTHGDRSECTAFGNSDLRSPQEGLWFQANCTGVPDSPAAGNEANCNRSALDPAEFRLVAPGLYVFRQTTASTVYLWYASAEGCFNLVSSKIVSAVCGDQSVTFDWNKDACSGHGGVLAWVNGG